MGFLVARPPIHLCGLHEQRLSARISPLAIYRGHEFGGFAYLTNGTISLWAKFDTNSDAGMRLLDSGYGAEYDPGAANSWSLGRDGYGPPYLFLSFSVYPAAGGEDQYFTGHKMSTQSHIPAAAFTFTQQRLTALATKQSLTMMGNLIRPTPLAYRGLGLWLCSPTLAVHRCLSHDGTRNGEMMITRTPVSSLEGWTTFAFTIERLLPLKFKPCTREAPTPEPGHPEGCSPIRPGALGCQLERGLSGGIPEQLGRNGMVATPVRNPGQRDQPHL